MKLKLTILQTVGIFGVDNSQCNYHIELGRRFISQEKTDMLPSYIPISTSNEMESPNDKILFDSFPSSVSFCNVKNNQIKRKSFSEIEILNKVKNMPKQYQEIYPVEDLFHLSEIANPSSDSFSSRS